MLEITAYKTTYSNRNLALLMSKVQLVFLIILLGYNMFTAFHFLVFLFFFLFVGLNLLIISSGHSVLLWIIILSSSFSFFLDTNGASLVNTTRPKLTGDFQTENTDWKRKDPRCTKFNPILPSNYRWPVVKVQSWPKFSSTILHVNCM